MKPPCEVVVRYLLPTVRALLARQLVERYDLNQAEVAGRLGTTQAAVSQYLSAKRGGASIPVERLGAVREVVDHVAQGLAGEELTGEQLMKEICGLCELLRAEPSSVVCELHSEMAPGVSGTCSLCAQRT